MLSPAGLGYRKRSVTPAIRTECTNNMINASCTLVLLFWPLGAVLPLDVRRIPASDWM